MTIPFRIAFLGIDHPHGAGWREVLPHVGDDIAITAMVPSYSGGITSLEERFSTIPRFNSVSELIANGEFDGAIVCLPNNEGPAVVEALANAGKAVLLEKPGAASEDDFQSAAKALRKSGVAFQTGYQWRYDHGAERIRAMIHEGRFGKLISIEMNWVTSDVNRRGATHYLFDKAISGRGFFNWLACHSLDLIPFLTERPIVAVTARVGCFGETAVNVDDGGTAIIELEGGTLVTFVGGYWIPRWAGENGWTFRGSQRWVQWEPNKPGTGGQFRIHGPQPQFHPMEETFTLPRDETPGYGGARNVRLIRDWVNDARNHTHHCRNTVDSTLATLRLLDAIYQSSDEGRRIECRIESTSGPI